MWTRLSSNAFKDLWPFLKFSVVLGVMLWLVEHKSLLKGFLLG